MNSKRETTFWCRIKNRTTGIFSALILCTICLNGITVFAQDTQPTANPEQVPPKGVLQSNLFPVNPQTDNPKKFYYEIAPGSSITDQMLIVNLADHINELTIYPVHSTGTNEQGSTIYSFRDNDEKKDFSEWLKWNNEQVALEPNEQRLLNYTITIPSDTPLGLYKGGFGVEKFVPAAEGSMFNTAFRKIYSMEVLVTDSPTEFRFKTANVFELPIYFWPALAIFIISTAYYFISKYKNGNPKKHDT